jgi:hypothetical protein
LSIHPIGIVVAVVAAAKNEGIWKQKKISFLFKCY